MIVVPMMIVHTVFHMLLIHVSSHEQGRITITQEELTKLPGTRISTECNSNLTGEAEPHAPSCSPSSCTHRLPSSSFLPNRQTDFPEINYEDISVGCFCFTPGHSSQQTSSNISTGLFYTPGCIHGTSLLLPKKQGLGELIQESNSTFFFLNFANHKVSLTATQVMAV